MATSAKTQRDDLARLEGLKTVVAGPIRSNGSERSKLKGHRPATSNGLEHRRRANRHTALVRTAYVGVDVLLAALDGFIAYSIRFVAGAAHPFFTLKTWDSSLSVGVGSARYIAFLGLYTALILLFCQTQDLYRTPRDRTAAQESLCVLKAITYATLLLTAFIFLSGAKFVSRIVVGICAALNLLTFTVWRSLKRRLVLRRVVRGISSRNVIIVGAGRVGQALAKELDRNRMLGYRLIGFVDNNHCGDPRSLGRIEDLVEISRREFVDDVFITIPSEREIVKKIAMEGHLHKFHVKVVPELYDGLGWSAPIEHIGEFPIMALLELQMPALSLFVKRAFDIAISSFALILLFPVLAAIAVAVRLDSSGECFYESERVGRRGRTFTCYKFRTMITNADALKSSLQHLNERKGPFFKMNNDPRVTRLGRFLRKYSLDELPQFWNVLKNDMSLVGPRPPAVAEVSQYTLDQLRRLDVKPGITGLWQVTGREDPSFETTVKMDVEYIERWSLKLDFTILLRTAVAVARGTGR